MWGDRSMRGGMTKGMKTHRAASTPLIVSVAVD
jgi:hypothetical protein